MNIENITDIDAKILLMHEMDISKEESDFFFDPENFKLFRKLADDMLKNGQSECFFFNKFNLSKAKLVLHGILAASCLFIWLLLFNKATLPLLCAIPLIYVGTLSLLVFFKQIWNSDNGFNFGIFKFLKLQLFYDLSRPTNRLVYSMIKKGMFSDNVLNLIDKYLTVMSNHYAEYADKDCQIEILTRPISYWVGNDMSYIGQQIRLVKQFL